MKKVLKIDYHQGTVEKVSVTYKETRSSTTYLFDKERNYIGDNEGTIVKDCKKNNELLSELFPLTKECNKLNSKLSKLLEKKYQILDSLIGIDTSTLTELKR